MSFHSLPASFGNVSACNIAACLSCLSRRARVRRALADAYRVTLKSHPLRVV